jgi:hypothetical protein
MNDPGLDSLHGADVLVFKNGDVAITGTTPGFAERSLVRGKGAQADWIKTHYNE